MISQTFRIAALSALATLLSGVATPAWAVLPIAQQPLFEQAPVPPLNMLVLGRDHKLYYEAYNDASDLDGDGTVDIGYKPDQITYFGYFDPNRCYTYDSGTERFTPASVTANKKCSGRWSGDFLNYLTTTRIDAMRKVLYGGKRFVDADGSTVLERSFIPQDAHSFGKEYESTARDGFNISEYTPLSAPLSGKKHLFANTSLSDAGKPLLRVLTNTGYRVWEWVSIERPVAGTRCLNGGSGPDCVGAGTTAPFPGHPNNRGEFDTLVANNAVAAQLYGGPSATSNNVVDCNATSCNPFNANQDEYLTVINGQVRINSSRGGTYQFRVDGDDAIDFTLRSGSATGTVIAQAGCYGGRGFGTCGGAETTASVTLAAGTTYYFQFRHEEGTGGDGYRLQWQKTASSNTFGWQTIPTQSSGSNTNGGLQNVQITTWDLTPTLPNPATLTDYTVRTAVCVNDTLKESNCKLYPNGNLKPTGLLHDYGETDEMFFGLMSGSQMNNLQGGVLRRNIDSFAAELDLNSGRFNPAVNGIVHTLDAYRAIGFGYPSTASYLWSYGSQNCPALGYRALANGECRMWGNPIAEMMYETLRYYAGATAPTSAYATGGSSMGATEETTLGLPAPAWSAPYARYPVCAKPFETVISDVNPSYDSDLPGGVGTATPSFVKPAPIASFSAATEGQRIWNDEFGGSRRVFIGESAGVFDGAPTVKTVTSFGNIRGLSPEEPTKEGSYYAASVARFGRVNDINAVTGDQKVRTYSVALASPLPRIEFPVGSGKVTLVPFAKSIAHPGQTGDFAIPQNAAFRPTNQIVDFYVEELVNFPGAEQNATINGGRPYAVFRINYEDVEQGNDHDMDVIVRYVVTATAAGTVQVRLVSEYQAGSVMHHIGYVISGTTRDGVYLEVRDPDGNSTNTAAQRYALDTPPGVWAGGCTPTTNSGCGRLADGTLLPLDTTREFQVGTTTGASVLRDPLWFAAKYGGFRNEAPEGDGDGTPEGLEWDEDADGEPDNYFLVTNALSLRDQLREAFDRILGEANESGGIVVAQPRVDTSSLSFIPKFDTGDWTGDLEAYAINSDGSLGTLQWSAAQKLPVAGSRNILTVTTPGNSTTRQVASFTVAGLGGATSAVAAIGLGPTELGTSYGGASITQAIDFLRGDQTREQRSGGPFRDRARRLGDIINSAPELVGRADDFGYVDLPAANGGGTYEAFVTGKATRTPAVFVGANDGMLHAFDATKPATPNAGASGTELWAFAPSTSRAQMGRLLSPSYSHRYLMDGMLSIGDAYSGSGWKTVLVGNPGAGGRSVFALDVTRPESFGPTNVLWELTDAIDGDIGTAMGKPEIVLLPDNNWYAIFGNGYNSAGDDAILYVVNLFTGAVTRKITLADGTSAAPNGLGNLVAIDTNFDFIADTVYAGDYQGNVWKVNFSGASSGTWAVAYGGTPLYVARDAATPTPRRQPITGGLEVASGPNNGIMVYFGTGKYFLDGDNNVGPSPQIQTLYGILDSGTAITGGRSALQEQRITSQSTTSRTTTSVPVDYSTKRGFYMDLIVQSGTPVAQGELFVGTPLITSGKVFYTTFVPVGDQCSPGGDNWLIGLNSLSGANELSNVQFGTTNGTSPCSGGDCGGVKIVEGPPVRKPALIVPRRQCVPGIDPGCTAPPDICDADGNCEPAEIGPLRCSLVVQAPGAPPIVLPRPCGRQSWRQVF